AYYYWRFRLPRRIHRPRHWGAETEQFDPPDGWGHGGFHDWYLLDYGQWGAGLVTPMYLLTGGRDVGRGCYLKPFPIERQLLLPGGPGLEQQFLVFREEDAVDVAGRWRALMARGDLFDVPWARLSGRVATAPTWLREAAIFQGWPYPWSEATVEGRVAPFPLVIDAPIDAHLIEMARQAGSRTAVYVNVMQQWVPKPVEQRGYDRPVFEFTRLLGLAEHPQWRRIGEDGVPAVSETRWWTNYNPCFLAPGYIERCLEAVDQVLDVRPDALFVDNCFFRLDACCGETLGVHEHRHDCPNAMAAYRGLVQLIGQRAHQVGVAMLCNSEVDPGLWDVMDGQMFECMWYCPGWEGREKGYTPMRYAGERWAEAVRRGGTVQVLNYISVEAPQRRMQALGFTYAWCRLHGLMWTDWYNLFQAEDEALREAAHRVYAIDLGRATDARPHRDGLTLWRRFENGIVLLNPLREAVTCEIPAASSASGWDVVGDETLEATDGAFRLTIGPQEGRILLTPPPDQA
ncbi:MAG: hypothetical protein ACP5KN_19635, partial [Armatimonadota bacterium]